jgi:predicted transcriptional regulator
MSLAPKCSCGHAPYYCNGNEHCLNIFREPVINTLPSLELPDFKKLRKDSGLTLRILEEKTGISNPYLSQLETGKIKDPSYRIVVTLIHFYSNYKNQKKLKQKTI